MSATRTLAALDMNEQLPRPLRDAFDVVAVDTRGTEPSTALWCEGPTGDAIVAAHTRGEGRAKDHAARCLTEIGALAEHVGVAQIARDVDVVREGLGYDRVSWLGQSWGTWVAATYAELFPTRTRAVVLDSPLPPPPGSRGLDVELPADVISVPDRFALWCAREASCRVAGDVFAYAKRAAANIADDGVDISLPPPRQRLYRDEVRAIVWHALLDKGNWPQLARALVALDGGDARPLAKLASEIDMDTQLDEPGARHEVAHHTIRCANLTLDGCETEERWPVRYTPPPPLTRETPPPTLVIVVDADGRTPPAGGLQMAAAMNASLVRVGGFGHVAFGDDSPCATKHAVHFLLEPKRIASVVRCGPPTPP